ncbi:MAG: hypothetical protein ABSD59_21395 [Terracidiphilus sp.]|jgi:hypothetical protein
MELTLNLGWALVAIWMLCAWVRTAPRRATDRRIQMVALAVAILILLPAISMTDDLVAAQNPAEIDCCVRRGHDHGRCPHSIVPVAASLPLPSFAGVSLAFVGTATPSNLPSPFVENPFLESIQNRPPPAV